MTDKVQKIREEVKRLMYGFNLEADIASCEDVETEKFANIKYQLCKKILEYIDKVQEEPVSEELEEASRNYADNEEYGDDVYFAIKVAFKAGAQWQKENLWKYADGEDLPEIGREVVAFQEIFPTNVDVPSLFKIVVAHRPNPEGYDGKSIATGEVEHYTPKTYGKGGWNIPDVRFWLDCSLPNMED